ncbi:hypothetical protein QJQ45_023487 [Haematococcus lacustris]|nr:hypothetical protein QJQ45_023487 [Haematococcus lacustris]
MKHSHSFPFLFSTRLAAAPRSAPRNMGNTTSSTPTTSASGPGCSVQASTAPSECPVQPAYRNPAIYNVYGQRINDPNAPASASPLQSVQNSNLLDPRNNMPLEPNQLPCPGQRKPLSVERVASAIPKGGTDSTWLFPSPQMVFNALRRKGKGDDVTEDDMDGFIAAHNAMNEDTWRKVAVWERLHAEQCSNPTLLRFQGKPHDLSPLARVRSWMSGQTPFDRHDWVVDRCGQEVRYVIDFYFYDEKAGTPEAFEIVARPALDSLEAVVDRVKMNIYVKFAQWGLPCPITGPSGSGQQEDEGQGQGEQEVIAERRQVIKAAFRALVEAALPDLSPAQVDAVVAQVNQRMTIGSMQCCLASLDIEYSNLLPQIKAAMDLLTNASVQGHMMRGPHHSRIRLLLGEVAMFEQPSSAWPVAKLQQLDQVHLQGDINSLDANATKIITSITEYYRHPLRFISWWAKGVGVVGGRFSKEAQRHFPKLVLEWEAGVEGGSIGKGGAGWLPIENRVRYVLFLNRSLEAWQTAPHAKPHSNSRRPRTCPRPFTMLPMVGVRARHFVIDDRVLHSLLADLGQGTMTRASQAVHEPVELPFIDRDTNPCLNFQRIGESKQRPLELCRWTDLEALPPIGKEYHQRYKLVNDRLPKARQRLHRAAEYRRAPRPQAPPEARWLDQDTNGCLNLQSIGESMQRPIELCSWKDLEALPPVGEEYQQGYKRVNVKVRQRLHRAAEYRRGINGRARNNA